MASPCVCSFSNQKSNEQLGSHSASSHSSRFASFGGADYAKGIRQRTTLEAENCAFVANKNITKKKRRERSSMEAAAAGFGVCLGIRRNRKKISIQFTVSVHVFFLFNDFLVLAPLHRSHFSLLLASSSLSRGRCYTLLNLHIISNQHPLTAASALLLPFSWLSKTQDRKVSYQKI